MRPHKFLEAPRRPPRHPQHRVRHPVLRPAADRRVEPDQQPRVALRHPRADQPRPRLRVAHRHVLEAPPRHPPHDLRHLRVAERRRPGDRVRRVVRALVGQRPRPDLGDVLRVDEADPPRPRRRHHHPLAQQRPRVRLARVDEVLHEPRRPQHRPLRRLLAQHPRHHPQPRRPLGDRRRAQQHQPPHPLRQRPRHERRHPPRRVLHQLRRHQIRPRHPAQRLRVGRLVAPVEAHLRRRRRARPTRDPHREPELDQPPGDRPPGVPGPAGHQHPPAHVATSPGSPAVPPSAAIAGVGSQYSRYRTICPARARSTIT